jgi:hypothetical protein
MVQQRPASAVPQAATLDIPTTLSRPQVSQLKARRRVPPGNPLTAADPDPRNYKTTLDFPQISTTRPPSGTEITNIKKAKMFRVGTKWFISRCLKRFDSSYFG